MDAYSLLRTLGGLATVLGMLAGALWIVRRYNIQLPGRVSVGGGPARRLEVIERTALDGRRSVALLRRDGREHLILLSPEGNVMLETAIVRDEVDHAAEAARVEAQREAMEVSKAEAEALRDSFRAMVDKASSGVKDKVASVAESVGAATGEAVRRVQPALEQFKERAQPVIEQVKARLAAVPAATIETAPAPVTQPVALPAPKAQARAQPRRQAKRRAAGGARG